MLCLPLRSLDSVADFHLAQILIALTLGIRLPMAGVRALASSFGLRPLLANPFSCVLDQFCPGGVAQILDHGPVKRHD